METDVKSLFDECLPAEIQAAISASLTKAYTVTESIILAYPQLGGELSREIRPHIRRVVVDACLRELSDKWPSVDAQLKWNVANNCQHVELHAQRIVLTANFVEEKGSLPRSALFRQAFANSLNMSLFADEPVADLPLKVYGHLLHGGIGHKPAFALISIPDASGNSIVLSRSLGIVDLVTDEPVEEIRDEVMSQLRISERNEGTGTV
jgi:hypothetical protein